jgi:hypothetical protein
MENSNYVDVRGKGGGGGARTGLGAGGDGGRGGGDGRRAKRCFALADAHPPPPPHIGKCRGGRRPHRRIHIIGVLGRTHVHQLGLSLCLSVLVHSIHMCVRACVRA